MAISLIAVGGWATGTTGLSVAYPAGIQAGDLLVLAICNKYPTNSPTAPTDWAIPTNGQQSGGSGSAGNDTGNVYATIMVKTATGSETGNLTVNIGSGNSAVGQMALYRKAADKSWEYVCTNGSDNSAGTGWSVTGAANPGITAGDVIFTCSGINTDSYTFSSHAMAATGVTFGTVQADGSGTNLGQDSYCVLTDHAVSSGTASAAPTFSMTASGTATSNPAGATVIMRLREVTAGYTLTAAAASYSLSGQASGLKAARIAAANTGIYTLTGNAASLLFIRKVTAISGAYTLSGVAARLVSAKKIAPVTGAYSLTGVTAGTLSARQLQANTGTYSITGNSANLVYQQAQNYNLSADSGTYSLAGQNAGMLTARILAAISGNYFLTGNVINLIANRSMVMDSATMQLIGPDVGLAAVRTIQMAGDAYAITGKEATLIYSADGVPVIIINMVSGIATTIIGNSEISNNFTGTSTIYNMVNI